MFSNKLLREGAASIRADINNGRSGTSSRLTRILVEWGYGGGWLFLFLCRGGRYPGAAYSDYTGITRRDTMQAHSARIKYTCNSDLWP